MPARRSYRGRILISDPSKGITNNLHFNDSWKATLRKYLGDHDFDAELNQNPAGLVVFISKIMRPKKSAYPDE